MKCKSIKVQWKLHALLWCYRKKNVSRKCLKNSKDIWLIWSSREIRYYLAWAITCKNQEQDVQFKGKNLQPRILSKTIIKIGEWLTFSEKQKLNEYSNTKAILKEILKGLLQIEKQQEDTRRKSHLQSKPLKPLYRSKRKKHVFVKVIINTRKSKSINKDVKGIKMIKCG